MFQILRGMSDILPEQQHQWLQFYNTAEELVKLFGYSRIDTPIVEKAGLFLKGVGEVTDILEKETYTFEDRGGEQLTLRPEGTAPICRAYLEHGMHNLQQPVRLYYTGQFFRYERPQLGRYRQLHQFGVEVIGDKDSSVDLEVIELGLNLLESLGLKNLTLLINSIGDKACRPNYIEVLRSHYNSSINQLCSDCIRRLEVNPLRLLDCKEQSCRPIIDEAPGSLEYLCKECADHWESLIEHLTSLGISFEIDNRLVRGFDYYTRTVFEFVPKGKGAQSTILAGGRYDGLVEVMGGKPAPGIGFGLGIERVLLNMQQHGVKANLERQAKVLVAYMNDLSKSEAILLCSDLRNNGIISIIGPSGRSLKSQMRYAAAVNSTHVIIIGENEVVRETVVLRDMQKSEQQEISRNELSNLIKNCQVQKIL